ncbi:unnamed protein product [Caenorhabditis nigoni]
MPPFTNSNPGNMPDEAPVDGVRNIEMTEEQALRTHNPEVRHRIVEKCTLINDIIDEILEVDRRDFFEAEEPRFNALLQDLEDDVRMNLI